MLSKDSRKHDMRRHRGVTAENAVDLRPFQSGIVERELRGHAHQVERGATLVPAESCEACAGDVAHLTTSSAVVPGHRVTTSPESITTIVSMDSGPAPIGANREDGAGDKRK